MTATKTDTVCLGERGRERSSPEEIECLIYDRNQKGMMMYYKREREKNKRESCTIKEREKRIKES